MPRHCSFCKSLAHNIRNCDSERIFELEQEMRTKFCEYLNRYPERNLVQQYFMNYLQNVFDASKLKVVAVHYAHKTTRLNKREYAFYIWAYYHYEVFPEVLREQWQQRIQRPPPAELRPRPRQDEVQILIRTRHIVPFNMHHIFEAIRGQLMEEEEQLTNDEPQKFAIQCSCAKVDTNICTECPICYETLTKNNKATLNCKHECCCGCVAEMLKKHKNMYAEPSCALCREPMKNISVFEENNIEMIKQYCK